MFDSPISKTQGQLAQAARAATNDYIQNGTDLTEAVVKAASAMQPLTSEHVRRICEMTYHDAYERMFAEKTGMHQYVTFDPPDAILAAEMLDALQLGLNNQANFDKLAMARRQQEMKKEASDYYVGEGKTHYGQSFLGHREQKGGYIPEKHDQVVGMDPNEFLYDMKDKKMFTDPKEFKRHMQDPAKRKNYIMTVGAQPGYSREDAMKEVKALHSMGKAASIQDDAEQVVRQTLEDASTPRGLARLIASKALKHDREGVIIKKLGLEKEASMEQDLTPSMPRKFKRMNTHEFWTKAASGKDLPDHNPTRELQQVHRDLKDSISTVKSELYSAEHNEKLAMIDMVKQAKAGLSAGHSMEQVLHAAVSVVDATEPFMAKTAHDLCATIIEACASHQNSGFKKEAQVFMGQKEMMDKAKKNSKGWKKNPMKLIYNFDHDKKASALQEVNPNHPIPQKFKKLAEANIQRKHLEVTLDELNRNLDYFNEQLKDELFR